MMKGAQAPLTTTKAIKSPQEEAPEALKQLADSLLESRPFPVMVWDRKCSQSEDKWGKLHGSPRQWCPGKHHHAKVCEQTLPTSGTNY